MRTCLAGALVLSLGAATTVSAQYGAPSVSAPAVAAPAVTSNIPDPGMALNPTGAVPPTDTGSVFELPEYARPQRAWFNAEYLLWWARDDKVQPIIQTFPAFLANTNPLPPGATSPLYPAKGEINYNALNGVRLSGGLWLDSAATFGIDGSAFTVQQASRVAVISSPGAPILAESYFSANNGLTPTALQFSNPDPKSGFSGTIAVTSAITSIAGGDGDFRFRGYAIFADTTDYLLGGRYFGFNESLDSTAQSNFKDGRSLIVSDHFSTTTQFYGAQVGFDSKMFAFNGFSMEGIIKLALGDSHQTADVAGTNTIILARGTENKQQGGLYAQPSNIGSYTQNKVAVLPELALNLSYNFTNHCAIWVGYNMLYINSVARPGAIINPVINDSNIRYISGTTPGNSPQPAFVFRDDSFWLQGITVGLRLQY